MPHLRISQPSKEGEFSVSKWLKHQVLLDVAEMEELCHLLAPIHFYNVSDICEIGQLEISPAPFIDAYRTYIHSLRAGEIPRGSRVFSSALSTSSAIIYAQEIQPGRYMARPLKPVIQLQPHRFFLSKLGGTIQPMVLSPDSIHWGIQFGYPQIFQAGTIFTKVTDTDQFPNTSVFHRLIKWLRSASVPTTFTWEGKKIPTPIRLGKNCFSWIHNHPQLIQQGIGVHVY